MTKKKGKNEGVRARLLRKAMGPEEWDKQDVVDAKVLLEAASVSYYNTGRPILADDEFDSILAEYNSYEDVPELNLAPPPEAGGLKVEHSDPALLGSLGNVYNAEELGDWMALLGLDSETAGVASVKYDGCSVALDIEDDVVVRAYTRGQDGIGLDLTKLFAGTVSAKMGGFRNLTLKCECTMTWDDFQAYCGEAGESYANPRTSVSGIYCSKDGPRWAKYLTLVALDFSAPGCRMDRIDRMDALLYSDPGCGIVGRTEGENAWKIRGLEAWSVERQSNGTVFVDTDEGRMELEEFYRWASVDVRNDLDVMADGVVFELTDDDLRESLGTQQSDGKTLPKWAIALKFPHKSAVTTLLDVEWDVANSVSGRVTPVAMIDPVTIDGKEYSRVSLSNMSRLRNEEFRVGGRLILTIRGDVLGYVSPDPQESEADLPRIETIETCPLCGERLGLNDSGAWLFCRNSECPAKLPGKICNYLARMRIKGVEESTITRLVEAGLLESITGLYHLDGDKAAELPGFGDRSVANIGKALDERREVSDWEFLGSWNWTGLGRTMMGRLMGSMTYEELLVAFDGLMEMDFIRRVSLVDGFSGKTAASLHNGLFRDSAELREMLDTGLVTIKQTRPEVAEGGEEVTSLKFVITGPLVSVDRDVVKILIMEKGHKLIGSVSKKTDYLVTNTPDSGTSKNRKAQELGVPIIGEDEFIRVSGIKIP